MNLEAKIEYIRHVKSFGEEYGLRFNGCLSRYDRITKDNDLYYLLVLPPNGLTPYLEEDCVSKSNRKLAKKEQEYRKKGYDTQLIKSLAWQDSQITKTILKESYLSLAHLVLHEGWHNTTSIRDGHLDEGVACAIECHGAIEYCGLHRKKDEEKARLVLSESQSRAKFIIKYYNLLKEAYQKPNWMEVKSRMIEEAKTERKDVALTKINNAYFYDEYKYYQHFQIVSRLFGKLGFEDGIKFFKRYKDHENCIRGMYRITGGR